MRLKVLVKVLPMVLCSLILVATLTQTSYAVQTCMAIPLHGPGMQALPPCNVPEPDPGIVTYALGLLGGAVVALRSKFRG